MRKLATIRIIDEIRPIVGADNIECAIIGGWQVVIKKDEFRVGAAVIYIEIDSWVPHEIAPFLSKGQEPKEYNGVKGERLRTVKLRGQISQGLILNIYDYSAVVSAYHKTRFYDPNEVFDVTNILGIQKYEAPIPAQLAGIVKGAFPSFIPRTDQERIQNLVESVHKWSKEGQTWEVSEKLDGSSMTVYVKDSIVGVCSRNLELKEDDSNSLWSAARSQSIVSKLLQIIKNESYSDLAFQGELIGEGIQGNPYKMKGHKYIVYDIYDIKNGKYLSPKERVALCSKYEIEHVPLISLDETLVDDVQFLLQKAEGKSVLNASTEREGLVYKMNSDDRVSFKAISNKFLIKRGE